MVRRVYETNHARQRLATLRLKGLPIRRNENMDFRIADTFTDSLARLTGDDVQPLRDLAAAETPFRANKVPGAKAAVTKLREWIAALLTAERQVATVSLDGHEAKLRALPDFQKLNADGAVQVLEKTTAAREAISSARFVTAIRDRQNRDRILAEALGFAGVWEDPELYYAPTMKNKPILDEIAPVLAVTTGSWRRSWISS